MIIIEKSGKTIDEAVEAALVELGASKDDVIIEVLNEGKRGILGLGAEEARVKVSMEENPLKKAEKYVSDIIKSFGIEAVLKSSYEDETVNIEIVGDSEEVGKVIGRSFIFTYAHRIRRRATAIHNIEDQRILFKIINNIIFNLFY